MDLNLKNARKLEAKINSYLTENSIPDVVSVRAMGDLVDAKKVISEAREIVLKLITERKKLIYARFVIRRQISVANEVSGINELISERVILKAAIQDRKSYTSLQPGDTSLRDQIILAARKSERSEYASATFNVGILTQEDIDGFKIYIADGLKRIETIEDDISSKNLSNKIVLCEDVEKLLKDHSLL